MKTDQLVEAVDATRDWTLMLMADIEGGDWFFQPAPGLPHILWLCGHIGFAEHLLILTRCLGGPAPEDDFGRHFPIGGPVLSAAEHDYPSPDIVLKKMADIHAEVLTAVAGMSESLLNEPCYGKDGAIHPHYKTNLGAVMHCIRHEGFHAGQIATIRRLLGKGFLR